MNLAAQGRFAEAEQVLRGIETTYPNGFEVRYRLGLILLRQGNAREAAMRFEAAAQKSPNSALAWLGLAQARLRLGQRDTALQAAGARRPIWQPRNHRCGAPSRWFYTDANEFSLAAEFEERWGRTPGADPDSGLRLCRLRVRADDKRAVQACLQAIAGRDSTELQQLLGDAYRFASDAPHAVEAYQRAIQLDPAEAVSYFKLASLFLDHRTPLPAIAILDSAVARFRNHE